VMRALAFLAALALSIVAYEIRFAADHARMRPVVTPDVVVHAAREWKRDPLDGLVPAMRTGMPRPTDPDTWPRR
jgi:hypothetical protein